MLLKMILAMRKTVRVMGRMMMIWVVFLATGDTRIVLNENEDNDHIAESDDFSKMLAELIEVNKGPSINDKLAKSLKNIWQKEIKKEKLKHILENVTTSENCEFVHSPKVNKEIYQLDYKFTLLLFQLWW